MTGNISQQSPGGNGANKPSKPPANVCTCTKAEWLAKLRAQRLQMLAGLIPGDSTSGIMIVDTCKSCGKLNMAAFTLASGRGDVAKLRCSCGKNQSIKLDPDYPLPPLGSDCSAVTIRKAKRRARRAGK